MKKVALAGLGYIGSEFNRQLLKRGYTVSVIGRDSKIESIIRSSDLVVNAIGYSGDRNVDDCDKNRGKTLDSNVMVPLQLNELSYLHAKPMIHVSSGCIFNGKRFCKGREIPWTERDKPNFTFNQPLHSFYTGSKYLAEQILTGNMVWICRIRQPFGPQQHNRNLLTKLARYPVIMDGINSTTQIEEGVSAMIDLYEKHADFGVYHVVNTGAIRTYDVYEELAGRTPNFMPPEFFYSPLCAEPRSNAWLSNEKLLKLGIPMRPVIEAVRETIKAYQ